MRETLKDYCKLEETAAPAPTPTPAPQPTPTSDPRVATALEEIADMAVRAADQGVNSFAALLYYALIERSVNFVIASIPQRAGLYIASTYDHRTNTITVNEALFDAMPTYVIAAVLVHEMSHLYPSPWPLSTTEGASIYYPPGISWVPWRDDMTPYERCLAREAYAEYMTGWWWQIRTLYRPSDIDHDHVRHLDHLKVLVRDPAFGWGLRRLHNYVREAYDDICAQLA